MRDGVLDDDRRHALRVLERHAEADGTAVVVHVERVAGETELPCEAVDDGRDVVERVREVLRVRPVAVAKARIVGSDQVIPLGEKREQRLEHAGRRRNPVEEKDRRGARRTGFSVEDLEPVDIDAPMESSILARALLAAGGRERRDRSGQEAGAEKST